MCARVDNINEIYGSGIRDYRAKMSCNRKETILNFVQS